jgi:TPR repeat protein
MRAIASLAVVFFGAVPAAAQNWQEYSYPEYSFTIAFPDDPRIETTTFQATNDRAVEARVYSVRHGNAEFKVTVAQLADRGLEETAVIEHAIKTLSEGGEVKVNIPHSINRVFGRQLSILQGDGSRAAIALFDHNGRLYQIEAKSLPIGNNATADAIRFVQSLVFTGGRSNRTQGELRAAMAEDDREAVRLLKIDADQGCAEAEAGLGSFYANGRGGLPKDDHEAARLFKLAADQGDAPAQNVLGVFYQNGRGGLPKDDREAARLYKLSADQGWGYGQSNLGSFYRGGRGGLPQDDREAARLFKLAADQFNLAADQGDAAAQNLGQVRTWFVPPTNDTSTEAAS